LFVCHHTEGIDLSVTLIGTPFEPEDEDETQLTRKEREQRSREKYTPLWKQEVFKFFIQYLSRTQRKTQKHSRSFSLSLFVFMNFSFSINH
jgi:hypothetical protein